MSGWATGALWVIAVTLLCGLGAVEAQLKNIVAELRKRKP